MVQVMANLTIQRGNEAKRQKSMGYASCKPTETETQSLLSSFLFPNSRDGRLMMCTPLEEGRDICCFCLVSLFAKQPSLVPSCLTCISAQARPPMSCFLQRYFIAAVGICYYGNTQAFTSHFGRCSLVSQQGICYSFSSRLPAKKVLSHLPHVAGCRVLNARF